VSEPTIGPSIHPRLRELLPEDGPTRNEVKQRQRPLNEIGECLETGKELVKSGVIDYLEHKAVHFTAESVQHWFGAASLASKISLVGKAASTLQLAYEVTEVLYDVTVKKPIAAGKEQAEGLDRDNKNLALLMIVQVAQPDALPDGFFRSECSRVLGTDGKRALNGSPAFQKASVLLGLAETDPELARSRDILVASLREGVDAAYQNGIGSKASFERKMNTDPEFRSRYASDPAFRAGVASIVWQATFHRDEYDTAAALIAQNRLPTTRM
jgi:hypothetical protein